MRQLIDRYLIANWVYWLLLLIVCLTSYSLTPTKSKAYKQLLSPYRWQTKNVYYINPKTVGLAGKSNIRVNRISNIVYQQNNRYFRSSFLTIYIAERAEPLFLNVSESGTWTLNVNALEHKIENTDENYGQDYPDETKKALKLLLRLDKELHLERAMEIQRISDQTLVLTGLNSSSVILFRVKAQSDL